MIVNNPETEKAWHARKQSTLHDILEDGTPAFANIIALGSALQIHGKLYGSMKNVSRHTSGLVEILYKDRASLTYNNDQAVCVVYKDPATHYDNSKIQGPTIAFNVKTSDGHWIGKSKSEQAAIAANIQLRTGGVCNPGGIAYALNLSPAEMKESFAEGVRCGNDIDEMHGKPTSIIRVSLGAMTTLEDINNFMRFLRMFAETQGEQGLSPVSSG